LVDDKGHPNLNGANNRSLTGPNRDQKKTQTARTLRGQTPIVTGKRIGGKARKTNTHTHSPEKKRGDRQTAFAEGTRAAIWSE